MCELEGEGGGEGDGVKCSVISRGRGERAGMRDRIPALELMTVQGLMCDM